MAVPVPVRTVTVTGAAPDKQAEVKAAAAIVEGTPIHATWRSIRSSAEWVPFRASKGSRSSCSVRGPSISRSSNASPSRSPDPLISGRSSTGAANPSPVRRSAGGAPAGETTASAAGPAGALGRVGRTRRSSGQGSDGGGGCTGTITLTLDSGVVVAWSAWSGGGQGEGRGGGVLYKPTRIDVSVPQRPALSGPLKLPQRNQQQEEPVQ